MVTLKKGKHFWVYWAILIAIVFLDILTKQLIRYFNPDLIILRILRITYIQNTGVAFGLFSNNNLIFAILGLIVTIGIILYIYSKGWLDMIKGKTECSIYIYYISTALISAGALGNSIDRFIFGHVTDFIYFSPFPAFNIADSAITVGGIAILYLLYKSDNSKTKQPKNQSGLS